MKLKTLWRIDWTKAYPLVPARPPQKSLIGIDFCGEGIPNAAQIERHLA
jgi:hypothetical protein